MKKTVKDVDVSSKRVLVRSDFNVPLKQGKVADDFRLRGGLPTIEYLIRQGGRVILCSHLGRPKGRVVEGLRLAPVADRLTELLGKKVTYVDDCVGEAVRGAAAGLKDGDVLLLENLRFHPGEEKNDPGFASELARPAELYVNDAFGAAHRAHASTEGVAHHLPAVAGLLMHKELDELTAVRDRPARPFAAILGGAKVSEKLGVLEKLLDQLDLILAAGGIANTMFMISGVETGKSLVAEDKIETAARISDAAGARLVLPVDVVVAENAESSEGKRIVSIGEIPRDKMILDVGPQTVKRFLAKLEDARTIIWNGPLGAFENPPFDEGTIAMAKGLEGLAATTVLGGGDSVAAAARAGVLESISHVSTGGGAFLAFIQGKELPGVQALQDHRA